MENEWGFETVAIHEAQKPESEFGAVIPPLHMSTTYIQKEPGQFAKYDYIRAGNPTRAAYEAALARLEGGQFGFAFASGCATTTTLLHLLSQGDHLIAGDDMYGGTFRLFERVFKQLGISTTYVDLRNLDELEAAIIAKTKMIWLETPTNPTMKIVDIEKATGIAKKRSILTVVDNTFMSPYFQNPLRLGADVVMHSATKYIGGHSDILGGIAATSNPELAEKLKFLSLSVGAVASPFDCFYAHRSLKTLAVRMKAHQENAMAVSAYLAEHKKIERVFYPGHRSHPQHELAKKQMRGFGGMLSFILKGGLTEAKKFLSSLKVVALAESLGGVESLIDHPAIMTHASVPPERRAQLGITDGFARLSVGIESVKDILADLDQALAKI